jgi:uncharacterized protein (TIGR02145 family)
MKKSMFLVRLVLISIVLILVACKKKVTDPGTETPLEAVMLISPEHGSILTPQTVELIWHSVEFAANYAVEVFNMDDYPYLSTNITTYLSTEYIATEIQDTTITTDSLPPGAYCWRACAQNGDWSNLWIFTISSNNPSAPSQKKPANGSGVYDDKFSFDWDNVIGAHVYELQVDTSSNFSDPMMYKKNLARSEFKLSETLKPDIYFWRIRSKNRLGNYTAWSDPWWFLLWLMFDIDGNVYKTVKICNQVWMAENLACRHYRNGSPIFNAIYEADWDNLKQSQTGGYCSYTNNDALIDPYGCLYNWYAVVDSRNIAPEGWHVPTDTDWKELELCLGMDASILDYLNWRSSDLSEGGKLKEAGTVHWLSPNDGATNESGFTALPSGFRDPSVYGSSGFTDLGFRAYFWSSDGNESWSAWFRCVAYNETGIYRSAYNKNNGFSVRLIKD